ncbi:aromatic ring-hydroxylating oxygenase subunit alpha [Longivirga aurantiaca]|uniref:Aromatic ring-hydroxylating dioxygenase subunit alpha n=1 Tax=Longivirga aurantiaca TaxID=1837743 RepID=A0ABW1SVQ8_9ACTN
MTMLDPTVGERRGARVSRDVYTSDEIYRLEKERVFGRTWHFACLTSDLKKPGDFFTVTVADQPLILLRGNDDVIRAFFNVCTHRAAILTGQKCGNYGRVLKCMYHAWAFNLEGELVGVPYEEGYGPDFDRGELGLVSVSVDTFFDLVFVAINPRVPSLVDYLGEIVDHLGPYVQGIEAIGRNSWTYEGNWKLWHENFRDNYHPEFAHRNIHDIIPHYADRGGNWALEPAHSVLQWVAEAPNAKAYIRSLRRYSGVEFAENDTPSFSNPEGFHEAPQEVLAVFPNLDVQPGPKTRGRGMKAGYIQTVTPLSPSRSRVDMVVYSAVDDDPETRARNLENLADSQGSWGKISGDDTEAAHRCQMGAQGTGTRESIFTRGVAPGNGGQDADPRDEYSLRIFYRAYDDYLSAE